VSVDYRTALPGACGRLSGAAPERDDALSIAALEHCRDAYLVRGGAWKADLWTAALPGGFRVVVKDFRAKSRLARLWGRIQVRREARTLRLLEGRHAVPRLISSPGRHTLVLEFKEGVPISRSGGRGRAAVRAMRAALDAVQEIGIVHNDLRGRDNVLVGAPGRGVVLVDWAGAVHLPPGTLRHRLLFGCLRLVDEAGYLKWKSALDPGALSRAEERFLARFDRVRWLWPFNRKRRSRRAGA
jgi:hypothetical protein